MDQGSDAPVEDAGTPEVGAAQASPAPALLGEQGVPEVTHLPASPHASESHRRWPGSAHSSGSCTRPTAAWLLACRGCPSTSGR